MVGEGSMSFTSDDASLGLIVSMSGDGTITFTAAGASLALTMAMGAAPFDMPANNDLARAIQQRGGFA